MTWEEYANLKPGDRVFYMGEYAGTFQGSDGDGDGIVEFNKWYVYGHTCNGVVKDGYGFYLLRGDHSEWTLGKSTLREQLQSIWEPLL